MSQNQLVMRKKEANQQSGEVSSRPLLDIYEAEDAQELARQDKLKEFYASLEFPCCGQYPQPKLAPIFQAKKQKDKRVAEGEEIQESKKVTLYDGLFSHNQAQKQTSNDILRLKTRLIRDLRQQYFQQNGQFIIQKQFFHEHLSRLANISFEENYAIQTFQKNAILSERNNQKKSTPFELEISIGCIWVNNHQLQNQQQRKFQELRALLKEYNMIATYPIIPELMKQKEHLYRRKQQLLQNEASNLQIEEIIRKIQYTDEHLNVQIQRVQKNMGSILQVWKQIKEIRRSTGRETVPWKINIKQYIVNQTKSYDFGVIPIQINERLVGEGSENQLKRRANIKNEKYFIRIYINGYEVAKSEKVNLQWPSFKVNFNQIFNIIVYSAPSSIQVEIVKAGVINQTIDMVSLTLPGIHSKTITSSEKRFAGSYFALNGNKFRRREQQAKSPSGLMIYRIEWKGQGSRMPPVSFKSQQQETAATEEQNEQNLEYHQIFDIRDPRFQKGKKQDQQRQAIQAQIPFLPLSDIKSARHLLLKLKTMHPQLQKLDIPLLEEQIRVREDLQKLLETERIKNMQLFNVDDEIYNPSEGIFKTQDDDILNDIKITLSQIQDMKIDALKTGEGKYKITEEIIDEYIFEQEQSPLVLFFKRCFTQKRKLGPQITHFKETRTNVEEMDINFHIRAARNMPIREDSFLKIKKFQEEHVNVNPMRFNQMAGHTGNMQMYSNYATGFYQNQPGFNLQGNNFFIPGMMNMGGGMRPNIQATYEKKNLERNSTYIELRFKNLLRRTDTFEGPYPQWNETLQFNYNLKGEGMNLEKIYANNQKPISLLIFDMTEQSKPTTAISQATIKKTKYYLGRIDVPMSLLIAIPSLSGLFKIQRPLLLFGYGIKKAGLFELNQDIQQANKTQFPDIHTCLNFDIFTDPTIDNMTAYNQDRKFISGFESAHFLQACYDWIEQLNLKRYIRLWLNNIDGKSVFICKYLSSDIAPPPGFGTENLIEKCAHFVSLIPKKFQCKLMENTEEFHLNCEQFLNIKMGEDHGILLCNFFNYIDKERDIQSYLAIGKAFPYGKSIFVLRRNMQNNDVELWDPYKGQCVFIAAKEYDSLCFCLKFAKKNDGDLQKQLSNMIELGCLVSHENVYINIQQHMKPEDLDFDLDDQKLWKPFLNQRNAAQLFDNKKIETIQPIIDDSFYRKNKGFEPELEKNIYEYLKTKLESERKRHFKPYTLKINWDISNLFLRRDTLTECQTFKREFRVSGADSRIYEATSHEQKFKFPRALAKLQEHKNQIKGSVDADKYLYGFTLNLPFTSYKDIWTKVQETNIHLDETQSLQFVLAVKCYELACHVISVWVFIGSIS